MEAKLKPCQRQGFNILMNGNNVFLTGDAGTGKSFVIEKYIKEQKANGKKILITAPTGIAALNIGGSTIHRVFKAPLRPIIEHPKKVAEEIKKADIVIIDEISMCRIDLFEFCIKQIVVANKQRRENGSKDIQIVVVGDFFQLPPVITDRDKEVLNNYFEDLGKGFAFQSKYWKVCNFTVVCLNEVVRQDNKEFSTNLDMARKGDPRCIRYITQNACMSYIENAITLCGTNKKAAEINKEEFDKIKEPIYKFESDINGEVAESDKVVPDEIELKVGTRVMTLINEKDNKYVNGSFGTIVDINDDTVTVKIDDGATVDIEPYTWNILGYTVNKETNQLEQDVIGAYTQIPLKLAYAITIHKSQGQTYDSVNLDPKCWDCGQLYVALSRVKDIRRMHLIEPLYNNYLKASREVKRFYNTFS